MAFSKFQKKSSKSAYLGKLIELNKDELTIDFLDIRGIWGEHVLIEKIRVIDLIPIINSLRLLIKDK
jgi:hypothetical protein